MLKVLANTKLVIIFLYRNVSNQLVVHLKFIQCYISILYLIFFFKDLDQTEFMVTGHIYIMAPPDRM